MAGKQKEQYLRTLAVIRERGDNDENDDDEGGDGDEANQQRSKQRNE
jgi:hypothetical protein